MKILVLGGTGAMGASLVPILAANDNEVTVTSRTARNSKSDKIHYLQGDALDDSFLNEILKLHYDAIVDFMNYSTVKFSALRDRLLNATDQYIYLSSSLVYADSQTPLTEESPRLLDTTTDKKFLETDEYALAKARQENLLMASGGWKAQTGQ